MSSDLAIPVFKVSPGSPVQTSLGDRLVYTDDPEYQFEALQLFENNKIWKKINKQSPNFGFTSSAFWFRFNIENHYPKPVSRYLELPIPFLDDIRLFHKSRQTPLKLTRVGDIFPFSRRPVQHQNFVMPVELEVGSNEFLLRVQSAGTIEAPLVLWEPGEFVKASLAEDLLAGLYGGAMLIMVLYNLFLYISVKDRNYLIFSLFVVSFLLFQISLRGYGYAYLWPDSIYWNSYCIASFISMTLMFMGAFVITFLRLKYVSRIGYQVLLTLSIVSAGTFLMTFVAPYNFTIRLGSFLVLPMCMAAIFWGYYLWWKGDTYARFFCIGWTLVIFGAGIFTAGKFGLITLSFWTENAAQLGAVAQVALLSFALADRINKEKQLRIDAQAAALMHEQLSRKAQQELIDTKEETNRELEAKVKTRTQALESTLKQLEDANSRLKQISITDSLTQLHNRGYFTENYLREFRRAHRQKASIAIVLCDIDNFKMINDNYGHGVGDDCLRSVADEFRNHASRAGDVVARYGGEEFIFMLVNSNAEAAQHVAENFRQILESLEIKSGTAKVKLTGSFGVAAIEPGRDSDPDDLIHLADMALYKAKIAGRNQVVVSDGADAPVNSR